MPSIELVTIANRPDLTSVVADWIWTEWDQKYGHPLSHTESAIALSTSLLGPPQTFILLVDGAPVGTSSFVVADLDERPDLTPWLASVFVVPQARRKGHAIPLIQAVESAARAASIPTLWLHTEHAARIYAKAGWQLVEIVERKGKLPVTLMRRDFASGM
jgi:GNAT superfamily N-acetyltransferase